MLVWIEESGLEEGFWNIALRIKRFNCEAA